MNDERIVELEKHIVQLNDGLQGAIDLVTIFLIQIGKQSPESLAAYLELLIKFRNDVVVRGSMREAVLDQALSVLLGEEGVPLAKRKALQLLVDVDTPAE